MVRSFAIFSFSLVASLKHLQTTNWSWIFTMQANPRCKIFLQCSQYKQSHDKGELIIVLQCFESLVLAYQLIKHSVITWNGTWCDKLNQSRYSITQMQRTALQFGGYEPQTNLFIRTRNHSLDSKIAFALCPESRQNASMKTLQGNKFPEACMLVPETSFNNLLPLCIIQEQS